MLDLDSKRWSTLVHAYGSAKDIPALLRQLNAEPLTPANAEPWVSLWSALAHQADVYTASFAAVPHIVAIAAKHSNENSPTYFHFVSWVEICRKNKKISIPSDLERDYKLAIDLLPAVIEKTFDRKWDYDFTRSALACLAVSKGHESLGESILELDPTLLPEFFEWLRQR